MERFTTVNVTGETVAPEWERAASGRNFQLTRNAAIRDVRRALRGCGRG
jgi:hypothetical protein